MSHNPACCGFLIFKLKGAFQLRITQEIKRDGAPEKVGNQLLESTSTRANRIKTQQEEPLCK